MTDFASEFRKVFGNSCPPQTDWTQPRYFDSLNNDCYAAEAALMASLTSEAYNKYGFSVYYFVKEHDTKFDPLFGEDQLENVKRRFALQVYTDNVPQLQKQYQIQGMIYTETVTVQCTIQHFAEASRYDWKTENPDAYDSIVPKIGDLMYFKYSDLYYEVINVKDHAEGTNFLSSPITYTFVLRVWRNSHENVDELNVNDDNMEHIRSYVELGETFNVDVDFGKHAESATIVGDDKPNHSTVAASGDILAINDTTNTHTLKQSKNADAMDVIYDPNKDFEPLLEIQDQLNNFDNNYRETFIEMGQQAKDISNEAKELQNTLDDIKKTTDKNVETITDEAKTISDDLYDIDANIETIQYRPTKRRR